MKKGTTIGVLGKISKSEKRVINILMAFLVFSFLAYFFSAINIRGQITLLILGEGLLCVPLLVYSSKKYSNSFTSSTRLWCYSIMGYMVLEAFNSLLFNPDHFEIYADIILWIFFLAVFYLSASKFFWHNFFKWAMAIMIIASLLSLVELYFGNFSYMRGEWDDNSYLYSIQLGFNPIVLVLGYNLLSRHKRGTILSIIIFVFYIVLQFYFQKRLPLVRGALIVFLLLYILRKEMNFKKVIPRAFLIVTISAIGLFYFVPKEYSAATFDRFYEGGTIEETAEEDARYMILEKAMDVTFSSPRTALFGQGLGGVVKGFFYGKTIISPDGREMDGLSSFEVGAGFIVFRYGLIFFFIIYGYIARLLLRLKRYRGDPIAMSCWLYLLVFFIMNFVGESFPGVYDGLNIAMLAATMGYLSSFNPSRQIAEKRRLA